MVNPDMEMCMRQYADVYLNSNVLRQYQRSEDAIKADRLAGDLLQHNVADFWKNVRNLTSNKASSSTYIDAVVGEQNIADYWRSHYEGILNSVQKRHIRMRS